MAKKSVTHQIMNPDTGELVELPDYGRTEAIKAMCTMCMGYEGNPVKECTSPHCPLYPFRGKSLSHNGRRSDNMTEEDKQAASERLKKAREEKRK